MITLKGIAITIVGLYLAVSLVLYLLQTRLIFYPRRLTPGFRFAAEAREVVLKTADGERINGLFFVGASDDVILYFHGNAGDLSGWQYVAEDFTDYGYNVLIIDYRGYGKSTGKISEEGFYRDAEAAWNFLANEKGFSGDHVIIYGRSVGTGVATHLASKKKCRGLVLEAPYSSLTKLANEKLPMFFPGLYLQYRFDNLAKINEVTCPIVFLHGSHDELIPARHTKVLYDAFHGKKEMVLFEGGSHNDLNAFPEHRYVMEEVLSGFFEK